MRYPTIRRMASAIASQFIVIAALSAAVPARSQDLFVSNLGSRTISRVKRDGTVTVFARTGAKPPLGLAYDPRGTVLVSVAAVGPTAIVTKILGYTPAGVRSRLIDPEMGTVTCLAVDKVGDIYAGGLAPDHVLKKITPDGFAHVFTAQRFNRVTGLAFDSSGDLFAADGILKVIVRITPDGTAAVFAKTGMDQPSGLAIDADDNVYVPFGTANVIRKYAPDGTATVFAKGGLSNPVGMAFDRHGALYVANAGSSTIKKYAPGGKSVVFAHKGLAAPLSLAFGPAPKARNK